MVAVKPMTNWEEELSKFFSSKITVIPNLSDVNCGIAVSHFSVVGDVTLKLNRNNVQFKAVNYFEMLEDKLLVEYVSETKFWRKKAEEVIIDKPQLRISSKYFFEMNLDFDSKVFYHAFSLESSLEKNFKQSFL